MFEITEASTMIQEEAHEDTNVIWGWVVDETMGDEARDRHRHWLRRVTPFRHAFCRASGR